MPWTGSQRPLHSFPLLMKLALPLETVLAVPVLNLVVEDVMELADAAQCMDKGKEPT